MVSALDLDYKLPTIRSFTYFKVTYNTLFYVVTTCLAMKLRLAKLISAQCLIARVNI